MQTETGILELALNLTEAINSSDRCQRLLRIITGALPCDAACLMILEDGYLKSVASLGLEPIVENMKFHVSEHPRLNIILKSSGPVVFRHDCELPDPFDGLIVYDQATGLNVHSCLGAPLEVEGAIIGVLTVDALKPFQFDGIEKQWLKTVAALAGATLQISLLVNKLESMAQIEKNFSSSYVAETNKEREIEFIGGSPAVHEIKKHIDIVAGSNLSILVTGETGVGKEIIARLIHKHSSRARKPLVHVNCAALPENLAESELFGHVKGAFTGAVNDRMGKFQLADGGTLFLDEIGELPLTIQAKLLRVLQEGEIQKVGSDNVAKVDVRLIAATNRNLEEEERHGRFRLDLFHRLSVYPIHVPPIRERKEDIGILIHFFINQFQRRFGTGSIALTRNAEKMLAGYGWPGNVRELENILIRAVLTAKSRAISCKTLTLTEMDFAL
ncbi:MAG: nitric oxide reductase transcriptional regulator NorR, partial [Oligoflexales bacterium]|nr:nitric oxide reductase transcriptional regulator NorR [Oligoflexales bacterium]